MSLRVQAAGVLSLLSLPIVLGLLVWALLTVSIVLAAVVGFAFVLGLQAAAARRWVLRSSAVARHEQPDVLAVVDRISSAADLPRPRVVVHEKAYANSWVTGLTRKRTRLHLTRGLLDLLDEHQLGAVIAHELAHVRQRDSALMSLAGTPVAAMTDGAATYFNGYAQMRRLWQNRRTANLPRWRRSYKPIDGLALADFLVFWAVYLWLPLLPIGVLFVVVGSICRAITGVFSRARELEADAAAALVTGNPAALSSALIALSDAPHDLIPRTDLRHAASLDAFHIVALGKELPLLHTHPSLKRRLNHLAAIEERLQHP